MAQSSVSIPTSAATIPTVTIRPSAASPTSPSTNTALLSSSSTISTSVHHRIRIRHPDYPSATNLLFDLFAPDDNRGGLSHDFVLVACGIITGNRWDGFLSETANGPRLTLPPSSVLLNTTYYFHVKPSSTASPYPIIPSFREWEFPHDNLPSTWCIPLQAPGAGGETRHYATSSLLPNLIARDTTCRMSACEEGTQAAHICPRSEEDWFERNEMSIYQLRPPMGSQGSIDDTSNALLLRADLHIHYDAGKLVFYPKTPATSDSNSNVLLRFVTHMLAPSKELCVLYHNTLLQPIPEVSVEFLFARFAWTIFRTLEGFLRRGVARSLIGATLMAKEGGPVMIPPGKCRLLVMKSRSSSPKKRERGEVDEEGQAEYENDQNDALRETLIEREREGVKDDETRDERDVVSESQVTFKKRGVVVEVETKEELLDPLMRHRWKRRCVELPETYDLRSERPRQRRESRRMNNPKPKPQLSSHDSFSIGSTTHTPTSSLSPKIHLSAEALREEWIHKERLRSDPHGQWKEEEAWVERIRNKNVVMGPAEARRFYEFNGGEFQEDD